jgi:hypothetical protein
MIILRMQAHVRGRSWRVVAVKGESAAALRRVSGYHEEAPIDRCDVCLMLEIINSWGANIH